MTHHQARRRLGAAAARIAREHPGISLEQAVDRAYEELGPVNDFDFAGFERGDFSDTSKGIGRWITPTSHMQQSCK